MSEHIPDTPSSEIEVTQNFTNIQFDSQILGTFMSCPREMDLKFNRHLIPIAGVSKAKDKGTLVHKGLQSYYEEMKKGSSSEICKIKGMQDMRELAMKLNSLDTEDLVLVYSTFEEYCEYRKNDVFQVVFTEKVFRVIAYESYPLRIILTGRIDLGILEYHSDQIIPIDHKSESEKWFYSSLSNQFKIYAIACNSQRLIVNRIGFQKSKKAEEKFKREDINFDKDALEEFKMEVLPYYAKQMLIAMGDNYYPPNYSSCVKGHWGCVFSDRYAQGICNIDRSVREQKIKSYFEEKEWDPSHDET